MEHTQEHRMSRESAPQSAQGEMGLQPGLSSVVAAKTVAARERMLTGIERYLTTQIRESIRAKIEQERQAFTALIQRMTERQSRSRQAREVLPTSFFEHKPFTTILE